MTRKKQKKVFFWLKLDQNFFKNLAIKQALRMPGGKDMIIVYQMLMLESLATDGVLYYEGTLPTVEKELAVRLDIKEEEIQMTMAYFKNVGLIQIDEDSNAEMLQVPALMEQETDWARYKRGQRKMAKLDNVQQLSNTCPTEIEKEIEKEIELEKEQEIEIRSTYKMFEEEYGRLLSSYQSEIVLKLLKENPAELVREALKTSVSSGKTKRGTLNLSYIEGILRNWQLDNVKAVSDIRKPQANSFQTGQGSQQRQTNVPSWSAEPIKTEQTEEGQAKLEGIFAELEAMENGETGHT